MSLSLEELFAWLRHWPGKVSLFTSYSLCCSPHGAMAATGYREGFYRLSWHHSWLKCCISSPVSRTLTLTLRNSFFILSNSSSLKTELELAHIGSLNHDRWQEDLELLHIRHFRSGLEKFLDLYILFQAASGCFSMGTEGLKLGFASHVKQLWVASPQTLGAWNQRGGGG